MHMRLECQERFPRHRHQRKPLVSDLGMHHGTCVTHEPRCMSGSLTRGGGENIPGIPCACANRNFAYLVRGPCLLKINVRNHSILPLWEGQPTINKETMDCRPPSKIVRWLYCNTCYVQYDSCDCIMSQSSRDGNCWWSGAYFVPGHLQPSRWWSLGLYSLRRRRLTGMGIPIINLRRSDDRLRFIMGIPILIRRCLLSEKRPWLSHIRSTQHNATILIPLIQ